ncbi:hypothetical protein FPJ27_24675 [Burkholderia sp. MS455]|uniref:hypothetical protein n=1 Tax=Burkholderia sp. MS455 TaxID=2811788 RepID=UPI00195615A2|nr:hypothetical protein [Burkholderia sp. MS455]QRR09455.1 hypothetical protein FPJ27_24675 [Burkholderia sp. MS455]
MDGFYVEATMARSETGERGISTRNGHGPRRISPQTGLTVRLSRFDCAHADERWFDDPRRARDANPKHRADRIRIRRKKPRRTSLLEPATIFHFAFDHRDKRRMKTRQTGIPDDDLAWLISCSRQKDMAAPHTSYRFDFWDACAIHIRTFALKQVFRRLVARLNHPLCPIAAAVLRAKSRTAGLPFQTANAQFEIAHFEHFHNLRQREHEARSVLTVDPVQPHVAIDARRLPAYGGEVVQVDRTRGRGSADITAA